METCKPKFKMKKKLAIDEAIDMRGCFGCQLFFPNKR